MTSARLADGLVNLYHARLFNHRGALLSNGEGFGLLPVGIYAGKLFAVAVTNRDLPVLVLAAAVFRN